MVRRLRNIPAIGQYLNWDSTKTFKKSIFIKSISKDLPVKKEEINGSNFDKK